MAGPGHLGGRLRPQLGYALGKLGLAGRALGFGVLCLFDLISSLGGQPSGAVIFLQSFKVILAAPQVNVGV